MDTEAGKTVYLQLTNLGAAERQVRDERVLALQKILDRVGLLAVYTGKLEKLDVYAQMVSALGGNPLIVGIDAHSHQDESYREPAGDDPVPIAESKVAQIADLSPAELDDLGFPPDLNFAITAGDIVASVMGGDGELHSSHQLSRLNRPLSAGELKNVYQMIVRRLHYYPKQYGGGRIMYETGTYVHNGASKSLGDKIEIIFDPLDIELIDHYFLRAIERGFVYSSNMQIEAIECLIESGMITSVSILPRELEQQGYSLEELRRAPTSELLLKIKEAIITNIPPHSY